MVAPAGAIGRPPISPLLGRDCGSSAATMRRPRARSPAASIPQLLEIRTRSGRQCRWAQARWRPSLSFCCCCLSLLVGRASGAGSGKKKKEDDPTKAMPMPRHSFQAPLEYTTLLDDWAVSGASLAERERLLLHPSVPGRHGFAFNKVPVLTNDFEVTFHFRFVGDKAKTFPLDQSFAFWYVKENLSGSFDQAKVLKAATWLDGIKEEGFTLSGSKGQFKGMGAILSVADAKQSPEPVVSLILGDGQKTFEFGKDVPTPSARKMDFRNTLNPAMMKIRVQPNLIEAHLKQSPSLSWNECFREELTEPLEKGGYIGFTAWSGTPPDGGKPDLVSIVQVQALNYDENSVGEEMDISAKIQEAYREMLTDENRHFVDQKSQKEHLERLTTMLSEHLVTAVPEEHRLFQEIGSLETRLDRVGEECRTLTTEMKLLMNTSEQAGSAYREQLKNTQQAIKGLRAVFSHDSVKKTFERVEGQVSQVKYKQSSLDKLKKLDEMADVNKSLEEKVSSRRSLSYLMVVIVLAIGGVAALMWVRMQSYERKHFL